MKDDLDLPALRDSDAPAGLRSLLEAGRSDGVSDADAARMRSRLSSILAPKVAPAPRGWRRLATTKAGVAGLWVVALAVGVSLIATRRAIPPGEPAPPPSAGPASHAPGPAAPPPAAAPALPIRPDDSQPSSGSARASGHREREDELIDHAQRALRANPRQALTVAERHARLYPAGQLAEEREVIVIDALIRLGRTDEAFRRAVEFDARWSSSPLAARVHELLRPR